MKTRIQRRATFQGLPINIEIEPGQERCGIDENGEDWAHIYQNAYGEIDGTLGADGDAVDVYLGPDEAAPFVYVVEQVKADRQTYDEDKCFIGFPSAAAAEQAYFAHGPAWGYGMMRVWTVADFKREYLAQHGAAARTGADRRWNGMIRYGGS